MQPSTSCVFTLTRAANYTLTCVNGIDLAVGTALSFAEV